MVDWLGPRQLASTGIKSLLASLFGAYADKREVQAALLPPAAGDVYDADYSTEGGEEFWFDYVADLADGFNPTYAVAWLLSRPSLAPSGHPEPLPRGRILVLGGDEIYPTPTREEYQNRFRGPYEAALPCVRPGERQPELFAVPGNHDWYDGLTSFSRLFCQGRAIGAWKTRQRRSYFAIKLPHNWWLWGIDIQLESDLDKPQMDFFSRVADKMKEEAGEAGPPRLIICTAQPTWVFCGVEDAEAKEPGRKGCRLPAAPRSFDSLGFFEERIVRAKGIRLVAVLSGDLHHYARYEEVITATDAAAGETAGPATPTLPTGPSHRIISGGGGAYLYPTHHMPAAVELEEGAKTTRYRRRGLFPSVADSRSYAPRCLGIPFRNRWFGRLLGITYLLFAWVIQSVSKASNNLFPGVEGTTGGGPASTPPSLMEYLSQLNLSDIGKVAIAFYDVMKHSPSSVVFGALVLFGLTAFRTSQGHGARWTWGFLHGLAHLLLGLGLIWLFSWFNLCVLKLGVDVPWWQFLVFSLEMVVFGATLGGLLFALYLLLSSNLTSVHTNEVYASQAIQDYKSFLRMRIDHRGDLVLYPIGVEKVPRSNDWQYQPNRGDGEPWFDPPEGTIPATLVEGPVRTF